ncbi:entericidin A/B family lipoprotein [Legionella nautarum]|jgi:predicted small secreted protein|nr:entericidin A/B family lipoprotein [Legionella nautarum]
MKIAKQIIVLSLFLTTVGLLNGCNTVKGFGKDVSKAGRDIQRAAN